MGTPRSTCILGLGVSGVAAARAAMAEGDEVTIYGGAANEKTRAAASEFVSQGIEVVLDDEVVKGRYDLCVVCPGIPATGSFYQSALEASEELVSEPEYAWRLVPREWIAVTGTNGKTTTTALIAHLLEACGKPSALCGNTQATTVTDAALASAEGTAIVAELSSFQLASTIRFRPRVGVLMNIASDHLTWHGSWRAYAAAKLRLFANMGPGCTAVVCDVVPDASSLAASLRSRGVRVVTVGSRRAADCAFEDESGVLVFIDGAGEEHALCSAEELLVKGEHNVENALAGAAAALDYGCDVEGVVKGLESFAPLEHRIEPAGSVAGVDFYNDSKATNVDATLKALTAFPDRQVVLMLGGRDKLTDLGSLVRGCEGRCAAVVCYGEGGPRFFDAFRGSSVRSELVGTFYEAFDAACRLARPGQVVLLSPACASFDEFTGFAQRGDVFKRLVAERAAQVE